MPIVLVQNPVIVNQDYEWKDILGQQYHFPNQYKNRCTPDTPFVYYRGTRRADGSRGVPEYFGSGRIGDVWRDETIPESAPKRDWAWFCRVEDYLSFPAPVPSKIEGEFLERIASNHWSVGVRPLPQDVYDKILRLAGIAPENSVVALSLPDLASVTIMETNENLLLPRKAVSSGAASDASSRRYSRNSLPIGRRAEEIAYRYLLERASQLGAKSIRWVAQEGVTPGWDLQYEDKDGKTIAVEVKGTTGPIFASVDITLGEWNAALRLGNQYWLYLIADCGT